MDKLKFNPEHFTQLAMDRLPLTIQSLINAQGLENWNLIIGQNDHGVQLNRGRWGSQDAGRVILKQLCNMVKPPQTKATLLTSFLASSSSEISKNLWNDKLIHLGCGHDHVYHLLNLGLQNSMKDFIVINFDAHADMRKDLTLHSGTPFRCFFEQHKKSIGSYHLTQIGLSKFYQNHADLNLTGAQVNILWEDELNLESVKKTLSQIKNIPCSKKTMLIVSIDADVLQHSTMSAVSAVNPRGIKPELLIEALRYIKQEFNAYNPMLGIYEYNPLYDELSAKGAKFLATLIYDWIFACHSNNS